jgi:hypothetical protein
MSPPLRDLPVPRRMTSRPTGQLVLTGISESRHQFLDGRQRQKEQYYEERQNNESVHAERTMGTVSVSAGIS